MTNLSRKIKTVLPVLYLVVFIMLLKAGEWIFYRHNNYYNLEKPINLLIWVAILSTVVYLITRYSIILYNLIVFGLLWLLLEFFAFSYYKLGADNTQNDVIDLSNASKENYYILDTLLGYKIAKNSSITVNVSAGDTTYTVTYHSDSLGRRLNPNNELKTKWDRNLIFFGGSFTEGYRLEDNQNLPFFYSQRDTNAITYNYGVSGYGTGHVLAQLESTDWANEIARENKTSIGIYIYIDHHIHRVLGDMTVTMQSGNVMPWYVKEHDKFIRKGFLADNAWKQQLYALLSYSHVLKVINFRAFKVEEKELNKMADFIAFLDETYQNKFNNDNFFVLIYPFNFYDISSKLKERGIKVLDYTKLLGNSRFEREGWVLPNDWHPNEKAHQRVSEALYKDLKPYAFSSVP